MTHPIQTPVALVTGGAVRLGRAMIERLSREGWAVVIHYHRSAAAACALRSAVRERGGAAALVRGALQSQTACERVIRESFRAFGRLDLLVNSAALFHKEPLGAISGRSLQAECWPNLFAPVLLTQAFAAAGGRGHVVNILDRRVAGHDTSCVPYLLSKKALADFTQVAALALAPRIRVNAIAPGPIMPPPGRNARYLKERAGRIPLDRMPTPEDIAEAVLALERLRATTGQIVFVDGGQHLLGNGV